MSIDISIIFLSCLRYGVVFDLKKKLFIVFVYNSTTLTGICDNLRLTPSKLQVTYGASKWCLNCPGGGGDSNIKKVVVLVVSLRGVNFRFWSRSGC